MYLSSNHSVSSLSPKTSDLFVMKSSLVKERY